jgi:uncharacterized protein YndB with AHSA1/START domain
MSAPPSGDQVRVSVTVRTDPARAFRLFNEEIDGWWRRGLRYRVFGRHRSVLCLEPHAGGRLFETWESDRGTKVVETGRVVTWEPPSRLVLAWRAANFAPQEWTEVEVTFAPHPSGTAVTVVHRGWSAIRPDHPARHRLPVPAFARMMGLWWGDLMTSLRELADQDPGPGPTAS